MSETLTADDLQKLPIDAVILNSYDEAFQKLHAQEWWGIGHYEGTSITELVRDSCRLIWAPEGSK